MDMRREAEANDWRESRRLRAWQLKAQGWRQKDIAKTLGVTEGAVSQWIKRGRNGGEAALKHMPPPGAVARLNLEQQQKLVQLLMQGPEAHGFFGAGWTQDCVRQLIKHHFDVSYHRDHIGRLLRQIGWNVFRTRGRPRQRGEAVLAK